VRTTFVTRRLVLLVALGVDGGAPAQQVYKWVDASGITHYGQVPPPGLSASTVALPAAGVRPEPASPGRTTASAPTAAGQASGPASGAAVSRLEDCAHARVQLRTLEHLGPVWRTDANGHRVYLPDAQRDAELARWRAAVTQNCAGLDSDAATRRAGQFQQAQARCDAERAALQDLSALARVPRQDLDAQRARTDAACARR